MGRHFEVRAKAMAQTAAKKTAIYTRASKEIYMAAKSGIPNPESNLALRSAIDKWKGQSVPKDVIERAIKKAQGGDTESYIEGRYEAFGPGGSYIIVDSLTDNVNRAASEIKAAITKKGGHMGSVIYNFQETGVFVFKGTNRDEVEETLILGDVDVREVNLDDGTIEVLVEPTAFGAAKSALNEMGITDFEVSEITFIPNETITIPEGDDKDKFTQLLDMLDDLQDVQNVYHNVEL